jgi:hypothetical protein
MQRRGRNSLLKISTKGYNMIPIYARKEGKLTLLNITELTKWETNSVNHNIELTKVENLTNCIICVYATSLKISCY